MDITMNRATTLPREQLKPTIFKKLKNFMAIFYSAIFLAFSISLGGLSIYQFIEGLMGEELVTGFVRSINTAVIALATYEMSLGIYKEYTVSEEGTNIFYVLRRTISRFVGLVSIALVLEGLIMVIKYSQLDLAGNLYYPVAIIVSASILLVSLGGFLHLTRADIES